MSGVASAASLMLLVGQRWDYKSRRALELFFTEEQDHHNILDIDKDNVKFSRHTVIQRPYLSNMTVASKDASLKHYDPSYTNELRKYTPSFIYVYSGELVEDYQPQTLEDYVKTHEDKVLTSCMMQLVNCLTLLSENGLSIRFDPSSITMERVGSDETVSKLEYLDESTKSIRTYGYIPIIHNLNDIVEGGDINTFVEDYAKWCEENGVTLLDYDSVVVDGKETYSCGGGKDCANTVEDALISLVSEKDYFGIENNLDILYETYSMYESKKYSDGAKTYLIKIIGELVRRLNAKGGKDARAFAQTVSDEIPISVDLVLTYDDVSHMKNRLEFMKKAKDSVVDFELHPVFPDVILNDHFDRNEYLVVLSLLRSKMIKGDPIYAPSGQVVRVVESLDEVPRDEIHISVVSKCGTPSVMFAMATSDEVKEFRRFNELAKELGYCSPVVHSLKAENVKTDGEDIYVMLPFSTEFVEVESEEIFFVDNLSQDHTTLKNNWRIFDIGSKFVV